MNKVIETIISLIVVLAMGGFCAFTLAAGDMKDFIEWLKKHKR